MGVRINVPIAGVLTPPLVATTGIVTQPTEPLQIQQVYVLNPTAPISVTLPSNPETGAQIVLKNVSSPVQTVTVNQTRIEGVDQRIELTDNRPVTFVWTDIAFGSEMFGWLMT